MEREEKIKMKQELKMGRKNRRYVLFVIIMIIICILISLFIGFVKRGINLRRYNAAKNSLLEKDYESAYEQLKKLGYFRDSYELRCEAIRGLMFEQAQELIESEDYETAIEKLEEIISLSNTEDKIKEECENKTTEIKYSLATEYFNNEEYREALTLFKEIVPYSDSDAYVARIEMLNDEEYKKTVYKKADELMQNGEYEEAIKWFTDIENYSDSKDKIEECKKFIAEERERIKRRYDKTVSAGVRYTLYITDEGKVHSTAYDKMPESEDYSWQAPIENWKNIKSISGFDAVIIGINDNNEVVVENNGNEGFNYRNTDTSDWNNIIKVCAGTNYALGLTSDGFVKVYGYSEYQETHNQFEHYTTDEIDVLDWMEIVDIATSWRTSAGLTKDGEIKVVGYGSDIIENDIENNAEKWKDVIAISLNGGRSPNVDDDYILRGDVYLAGLKKDGTVVIAGLDSKDEELWKQRDCEDDEEWHDIMEISAGDWYVVGLRKDGKVLITGKNHSDIKTDYIESDFDGWNDFGIVNVDAGYGQIIGLTSTGLIKSMIFVEEQGIDENDWKNVKTNSYLEK